MDTVHIALVPLSALLMEWLKKHPPLQSRFSMRMDWAGSHGSSLASNGVRLLLHICHIPSRAPMLTAAEYIAYNNAGNARDKAAISMSLGGSYSKALNDAVAAATAGGMTVSVAAGNEDKDVAGFSPASAQSAITVAAIDSNDYRASFSNWGSGVDVFAAGVDVTSAWIGSNSATNTISGTSMGTFAPISKVNLSPENFPIACPHVSGLAAYYIRLFNLSGKAVKEKIISTATKDKVIDPKGSPNRIAYNSSEAEAAGY